MAASMFPSILVYLGPTFYDALLLKSKTYVHSLNTFSVFWIMSCLSSPRILCCPKTSIGDHSLRYPWAQERTPTKNRMGTMQRLDF